VDIEVQRRLLTFYQRRFASWGNIKIPNFARISDGWENEVYSFTVEHGKPTERTSNHLILRIYPGEFASRKTKREFDGMEKLHQLGFPVPEVLMLGLDDFPFEKPFVIMEKIDGRSMGSAIDEADDEKRQELITLFCSIFVDLHALDWRAFASDPSVYETEDPNAFVNRWISWAQERIDRHQKGEFQPVLDWLRERSSDILCKRLSVIHFDYHPYNVLLQNDGRAFVIDWTNIDIADFRLDLAWTILLTSTYGNPEAREIILREYERIAGHRIEQMEFFEVAAVLRRLYSISASLSDGSAKLGMRPEAVAMMKQNVGHIKNLCSFLYDRTSINIPEMETLILDIS